MISRSRYMMISGIAVVFALLLGILSGCGTAQSSQQSGNSNTSGLQGTDLGESPAPNFQLVDQYHHQISLTQFRGMPVVLTFFYTHCPDYCPLIATKIHSALVQLGSQAQQIAVVAVSADPSGDTVASVATFSQEHQLAGYKQWHYLLGSRQQLSPVWASYHVSGVPPHSAMMSQKAMQHSAVVYLIDQQGRERVLLDSDFAPTQLSKDVQTLLTNHAA